MKGRTDRGRQGEAGEAAFDALRNDDALRGVSRLFGESQAIGCNGEVRLSGLVVLDGVEEPERGEAQRSRRISEAAGLHVRDAATQQSEVELGCRRCGRGGADGDR
jgi:transposase